MPYCTDSTVWQPLDDNFFHLNLSGYPYADKLQGAPHQVKHNLTWSIAFLGLTCAGQTVQLMNIHNPLAPHQESLQSYTLPLSDVPSLNLYDPTSTLDSPTSPCTSLSSFGSDSEPSPRQHRQYLDDAASTSVLLSLPAPPVVPSIPQMVPPVSAHQYFEAPVPRRPSIASAPPPAPDSSTPGDTAGRRAPKQRRVTRAVQPLACYFCRGRKIACGPPAEHGSDRTCEYVPALPLPKSPDVSCSSRTTNTNTTIQCVLYTRIPVLCSVISWHPPLPVAFPSISSFLCAFVLMTLKLFFPFGMDRPCARRRLVCEYPAKSYRGRRSKETPVKPQRR